MDDILKGKDPEQGINDLLAQFGITDMPEEDEFGDPTDPTSIDDDDDSDTDDDNDSNDDDDNQEADDDDDDVEGNEDVEGEYDDAEPQKKRVQTPEENARFAEMRRQRQMEERIQQELQKRMQETPEFQIAKLLAEQYGTTPEQLYEQVREATLQRKAQQAGVPVEFLRKLEQQERENQEVKQKLMEMEFRSWYADRQVEADRLKQQYNFLTDAEIDQALNYMLDELGTTKMSLEQAVFALHGQKIAENLNRLAKQEALAEISGRKRSPLGPQGGKQSSAATSLTPEERMIAKAFGVSEEDYLKWK